MNSLGTAEAVVTVSKRVAPRAAAGFGLSWNRTADGMRWVMVSGFPRSGRLLAGRPAELGGPCRSTASMAIKSHVMPGVVSTTTNADATSAGAAPRAGAAAGLPAPAPRSDVRRRDDILADRHDAIYRDGLSSRVREVA
jgi:hypothetical protein